MNASTWTWSHCFVFSRTFLRETLLTSIFFFQSPFLVGLCLLIQKIYIGYFCLRERKKISLDFPSSSAFHCLSPSLTRLCTVFCMWQFVSLLPYLILSSYGKAGITSDLFLRFIGLFLFCLVWLDIITTLFLFSSPVMGLSTYLFSCSSALLTV